jgi:DNA modification methylase
LFFLGSGTTTVVANKLDRKFSGIELEKNILRMQLKRLEDSVVNKNIQRLFWRSFLRKEYFA